MRSMIAKLERTLAGHQGQLDELSARNRGLRVRWAALELIGRCLCEIRAHRAAFGGGGGAGSEREEEEAYFERVRTLLSAAADPSVASEPGSGGSAPPSGGAGGDALARTGSAGGDGEVDGLKGADAVAAKEAWAALINEAVWLLGARPGAAAADQAGAAAPRPPGAPPGALLVGVVPPAGGGGGGGGGGASSPGCEVERLRDVGLRMLRWKTVMCLNNLDAYMPTSCTRLDEPRATQLTCGGLDPPLGLWEAAMLRHAGLTRRSCWGCTHQITALREDRAALTRELAELMRRSDVRAAPGGGAPPPPGGAAACLLAERHAAAAGAHAGSGGGGGGEPGDLSDLGDLDGADEVIEELEANTRCEGRLLLVCWQAMPAVFTPCQWAKFVSNCWPWPVHEATCCRVLEQVLRLNPGAFAKEPPV
ncbi:MAG: hypothetical protein J3K34DRAFT_460983 [Monoraphidium minutum]|nr:MAG: hypothetical protein J3K34DRAFT_460983 [Monoraphidium minutum]